MTTLLWTAAGAVVWFACGVLSYGLMLARQQRRYPMIADKCRDKDRFIARIMFMLGPCGLAAVLFRSGVRYGFMWHLPPRTEGGGAGAPC